MYPGNWGGDGRQRSEGEGEGRGHRAMTAKPAAEARLLLAFYAEPLILGLGTGSDDAHISL